MRRGSSNHDDELQKVLRLGRDLEEGGAVVIYPEGTRFSAAKRERLLEKFSADDPDDLLGVVQRLRRTLPPLRDGAKQLVEQTSGTDVVFIAHRGVDDEGAMRNLVRGRLTGAHLEVKMWRVAAVDVPRDPAGVRDFMLRNWELVDAFATGEEIETGATDDAVTGAVRRLRNAG